MTIVLIVLSTVVVIATITLAADAPENPGALVTFLVGLVLGGALGAIGAAAAGIGGMTP
jgi:hypothetical protein